MRDGRFYLTPVRPNLSRGIAQVNPFFYWGIMRKITQSELRDLLHYSEDTGEFTWRYDRPGQPLAGSIAGCTTSEGYIRICVNKRYYLAHRLAWLYMFGEWPAEQVDHINQIKSDNRRVNLRSVTHAENMQNRMQSKTSISGYHGVYPTASGKKWMAKIRHNKKIILLGIFTDPLLAHERYLAAKAELHPLYIHSKEAA